MEKGSSKILSRVIQEIEHEREAMAIGSCPEQDYENCDACGNNDCNPEPFKLLALS